MPRETLASLALYVSDNNGTKPHGHSIEFLLRSPNSKCTLASNANSERCALCALSNFYRLQTTAAVTLRTSPTPSAPARHTATLSKDGFAHARAGTLKRAEARLIPLDLLQMSRGGCLTGAADRPLFMAWKCCADVLSSVEKLSGPLPLS